MNPIDTAVRAGTRRGLIELRQMLTTPQDLWGMLFWPVAMIVVLFFMRDAKFQASGLGLGSLALPSILGMFVAFNGMFGIAQALTMEREDGTLLRAKATPNGMVGYLIGKIVTTAGSVVVPFLVILIPGLFLVDGTAMDSVGSWLSLIGIVALGMIATMPAGAVLGSLFSNPRNIGFLAMPVMGIVTISGIFYPITSMPGWLQGIAQVFPIYWVGIGMRAAMLPGDAVAIELGHSWRHLETIAVLGVWAVAGLLLAPVVLRRMARRESGSSVAARRERAIQRAY
ncbi:ABC transporter permease [Nocardia sp. NPDC005998]|uniref:ABC transporter permease n=1 Tax=Nocardia sp. NPDC005998 TaxID=3156894 RepID=UPI0033AFBA51